MRRRTKKVAEAVGLLYSTVKGSMETGENSTWSLNDLCVLINGNEYVTEKKKLFTRYIVHIVQRLLKENENILFYSVPKRAGKRGYRALQELADFENVAAKFFKCVETHAGNINQIHTKATALALTLPKVSQLQLNAAKNILNIYETYNTDLVQQI